MTYLEKSVTNDLLAEAFTAIEHSVQKRVKKLLLVCADEAERAGMIATVWRAGSEIIGVATAGEALAVLKQQYLDGIVVHLRIDGIAPMRWWKRYKATRAPMPRPSC